MSRIYYWDSSVLIAFIKKEVDRVDAVEQFLDEAEAGDVTIVTSYMTLTEVVHWEDPAQKPKPIKPASEKLLKGFFQKDYFEWVNFDRKIAESARDLIWEFGLKSKDAVHMASALECIEIHGIKFDAIHSYDRDFTNLNGRINVVKCPIEEPIPTQQVLKLNDVRKKAKGKKRAKK